MARRLEIGLERVKESLKKYDNPIYVQSTQMFGDALHGSMVAKHYRSMYPNRPLIWAISEKYGDAFKYYNHPTEILHLPHLSNENLEENFETRRSWAREAAKSAEVIKCCVGPFGWNCAGSIVDAVLYNAGIKKLAVARKPMMPLGSEDEEWAENFIDKHDLNKFVVLEYNSYTFSKPPHNSTWSPSNYNRLLAQMKYRTVWTGAADDPPLNRGIDARGISWRQAAALIKRARLFVGCASGLTMVAVTKGIDTPILEVNIPDEVSMRYCGYKDSRVIRAKIPEIAADIINETCGNQKR